MTVNRKKCRKNEFIVKDGKYDGVCVCVCVMDA